ncbi:hypothetical protein CRM22_008683 [Opisthorchis felineus]|uniref:Beta-1,4-galactosyltransferase n=1 Tax=Opisthorchis felineus TaxID=147828 RepID=A0A4S2LH75_OPIFE|nr:hypothetical protein CRM22_008683 [Opisthorchis felineus]
MRFRWIYSPRRIRSLMFMLLCIFLVILVVRKQTTREWQWARRQHFDSPLKIEINRFLTIELARLLRRSIPPVEDVGEMFMEEWFKREETFCSEITQNVTNPLRSADCLASCLSRDQWLELPPQLRRNLIIIPFRSRQSHLKQLLPRLEQVLAHQNVCYLIVIAEQVGNDPFNKGALMNSAFVEALKWFPFHCVTFHDVDLLPLLDEVPYTCATYPRHVSVLIDKFRNRLPYAQLIGGILTIPVKMYLRVNGFSNLYWAWGAEDDDMYERLMMNKIPVIRADPKVSMFRMLRHRPSPAFPADLRSQVLSLGKSRYRLDGLNSLNFTVVSQQGYAYEKPTTGNCSTECSKLDRLKPRMNRMVHMRIDVGRPPIWLVPQQ